MGQSSMALIAKGEQRTYNGGYLFLQNIYYAGVPPDPVSRFDALAR